MCAPPGKCTSRDAGDPKESAGKATDRGRLAGRTWLLLLHRLGRKAEDHERIAQRIADLEVAAARHGDELLTAEREGHRGRIAARPGIELPQQLAGPGIVGVEVAVAF